MQLALNYDDMKTCVLLSTSFLSPDPGDPWLAAL